MTAAPHKILDYCLSLLCLAVLVVLLPPGGISAWSWEMGLRWLYVGLVAFFCVIALMPAVIALSRRVGAMDHPDARKTHPAPTPKLGGLAVFIAVLFAAWRSQIFSREIVLILAACAIIFLMGLLDDIWGLGAMARLGGQALASLVVIAGGMTFASRIPPRPFASDLITMIWLIGITNAFNFLDGIDGLGGGLGVVCSVFFMGIAWNLHQMPLAFLSAALMGACAGFLRSNWHPAKVFLGDGGASFIGFLLAALAVYGGWANNNPIVGIGTPILILGVPIFDMIYITLSRVRRGDVRNFKEWIEYVGRDHFHHRLLHLGLGVQETVLFILTVSMILGLSAWTLHYTRSTLGSVLLAVQGVLIFLVIVVLMLLGREMHDGETAGRGSDPRAKAS